MSDDLELTGLICSKCGTRTDPGELHECPPVKVFKLNDCDWWAGYDLESCKLDFLKFYEMTEEDEPFHQPYELTEREMEQTVWVEDLGNLNSRKWSFREALNQKIARGETFPSFFASTEY